MSDAILDIKRRVQFRPCVGDIVEFLSDRQAEKGPSSGSVTKINRWTGTCIIKHSDHPGEMFLMRKLKVENFRQHRNHQDRLPYWGLV